MVETYYSAVNGIWDELVTTVEDVTWLSGVVYKNTWRENHTSPEIIVDFVRDGTEFYLLNQGSYYLQPEFDIIYRQLSNENKELAKAMMVSGVGAVIDQIRSHTSNCPYWEKIQIIDVDYKWYSPGMAPYVIDEAKIRVRVKREWGG